MVLGVLKPIYFLVETFTGDELGSTLWSYTDFKGETTVSVYLLLLLNVGHALINEG